MKLFPNGRDGWIGFLLFPFKVFVIVAPIIYHLLSLYVNGSWRSRYGAMEYEAGLILCVPILLLGALLQATACKHGESLKTLVFAGVAFLIIFYPVFYPPSKISFIVSAVLNLVLLYYSVLAFYRTKINGFLFLLLGFSISLISSVARIPILNGGRPDQFFGGNYGAYQDYIAILGLASLVAQLLWTIGIILIIRHFLQNFQIVVKPEESK